MQHPGNKKIAGPLALTVVFLLWMGSGSGRAVAQNPGDPGSPNVARVSFAQGSVQLLAGQGSDFQQAVMNMPVVDGARLQTGADGQAEVEFGDGSVARLTPNSTVQFDHLGQDRVQLQQLSGLSYYEFNVGDGHPPFSVLFNNLYVQPTASAILRVGLDAGWEVAVISGSVNVQGDGIPGVTVAENQSIRAGAENSGAPYTVAQGINGDSWDNWNQDRDQAIAQEASQQTPVRDDSANSQNENWNDLDADGNWYPVEGTGNVWVPAGVGPDWDPYGSGSWAYYPTLGYTWVSGYPWGWLPYHCGAWGYYPFGWGWAPGGGCGRVWHPVIVARSYPRGWSMPVRPFFRDSRTSPRLVAVDRGPAAKGPWGMGGAVPRPDHQQALNFNGGTLAPVERVNFRNQGFSTAKGTAPGVRTFLSGAPAAPVQRPSSHSEFSGAVPPRALENPNQRVGATPNVGYPAGGSYNQRSTYEGRPMASPHYSAPPQPRYAAPPPPHYSAPPPSHAAPSGAHR
jgi:hypothetical protein